MKTHFGRNGKMACLLFAACTLMTLAGHAQDLTTGIQGYWPFDSFENGIANDASGNGRDATIGEGEPVLAPGKMGNALFFDGDSDLLVDWKGIGGNNPRTISLWLRSTDTGNGMVGWGAFSSGEKWHFRIDGTGQIRTEIEGSYNVGDMYVADGEWHHVVSVFEGENIEDITHYVDGVENAVSSMGSTTVMINTAADEESQDVSLGSRTQGDSWNRITGSLDDIRIYDRALSQEEVLELYDMGNAPRLAGVREFSEIAALVDEPEQVIIQLTDGVTGTLTETVPEGWTISDVSNDGEVDGNTITWELSTSMRSVNYTVTPTSAALENLDNTFTGDLDGLITGGVRTIAILEEGVGEFNYHADIGEVGMPGSVDFDGNTYYVEGSGSDVYGTNDEFHYLFREISGPFDIQVTVYPDPYESESEAVKTGLMIRQDIRPDSPNFFTFARTMFDQQSTWRTERGGQTSGGTIITLDHDDAGTGVIELRRRGNIIQSWFERFDGTWYMHAQQDISELQDPILVGLAVTSHEDGSLSMGEFSNLNIEPVQFTAFREINYAGEGQLTFGDIVSVTVEIFQNETDDITVSEVPPVGWDISNVETSIGTASSTGDGAISWSISDFQGLAEMAYDVQVPENSTTPTLVGEFQGLADGNEIKGDTSISAKGLLPDEILDPQDISSGLIGHWTFDDGSGTTVNDISGNGHDAEVRTGSPTWIEGIKGTALEFDGESDLYVPNWYGMEGSGARTITAWIRTTATNTHGIISWGLSSGDGQKYHLRVNDNAGNGQVGAVRTEIQGTFNIGEMIVNDDEWHFIASVFPQDGEFVVDIQHYVDGLFDEVISTNDNGESIVLDTAASEDVSDQLFRIGSRHQSGSDHYFPGAIDEVRFYNRALTNVELQAVMVSEGGRPTSVLDYMLY